MAGGLLCALGFGLLPEEYVVPDAPPWVVIGAGSVMVFGAFAMLARDHRGSEMLGSILLLALAGGAGWLTFYAPEGTSHQLLPFIPETVHESMGRLLFGFGMVACIGMGAWALRRMLR
jgi:hypothetical protein